MKRNTVHQSAIVLFLLVSITFSVSAQAEEPLSRGKRWIRNHPFTTMALTMVHSLFKPDEYQGANLNTVLSWKIKTKLLEKATANNLPWHLHVYPHFLQEGLTDKLKATLTKVHGQYPGLTGWMVYDEVQHQSMHKTAEAIKWLKDTYPDTLVYSNALPLGSPYPKKYWGFENERPVPQDGYPYEQYIRDFATIMQPDVVMFDAYPFHENCNTSNLMPTLNTARKIAQEQGIPYWAFVQSHNDPGRGYRMPSESDIRMQVFMHLAYGFTGIAYFTYEQIGEGTALISETGKRNPIYYDVTRLNQEVGHVGQALRFLESTDVRYVTHQGNTLPDHATAWQQGAGGDQFIKAIIIEDAEPAEWKDVLIGYFRDDDGQLYFMLTNLWHGKGATAADRTLTVTLTLDSKVQVISRLSRETGQPESFRVNNGKFQITFPGGTGELLRFGDAQFPGLDHD